MPPSDRLRGSLLVLGASLGFASLGTLANLAYEAGMESATFVLLRASIGAALLGGYLALRPARRVNLAALPWHELGWLAAAIVVNGVFNLVLFAAFHEMAVPVVLAIYFTYPTMVAAASVALGRERLTFLRVGALALAVGGVLLILGDELGGASVVPIGVILAFGAALDQAGYIVISRHGFPSVPAEQAIALVLAGGAGMAAVLVAATQGVGAFAGWSAHPGPWLAVLAAAVLGTAAAKVWVLKGLRLLGGTRTAVIMLGEPLGGILLAAVVLDQPLTAFEAAGGALIILAALLVQRPAPGSAAHE